MKVSSHNPRGLVVHNHRFRLPLDPRETSKGDIEVFARELVHPDHVEHDLPYLLFLQGGPGSASPRPLANDGWIKRALQEFRVLLLDQRGTGLSSPINSQTLARLGSAENVAAYLRYFRADGIVADAEAIRKELTGGKPWAVLGQSYGGFCIAHYLSTAAEGLSEAFITGGIPPIDRTCDEIYQATYKRVRSRNERYYARYPEDVELVRDIASYLRSGEARLPSAGTLSVRKLQALGLVYGMSYGFEQMHYLLEEAFVAGAGGMELGYNFLRGVENASSFETNPIFAILHEPIYAQGWAPSWSAERIRKDYPEFDPDTKGPVYFTGEMIYPWMFEEFPQLVPLKEAAHILAEDDSWPRLYHRDVLETNSVPCAAAVYDDDMYVEREFSLETAETAGIRTWITNEYDHNGLRADGERILGRLIDMARGNC